jgi:hypothetical protein
MTVKITQNRVLVGWPTPKSAAPCINYDQGWPNRFNIIGYTFPKVFFQS